MTIEKIEIENTSIWEKTLAKQENDPHDKQREKLRTAFFSFRKNISYLVSSISKDLPGLTVHDITHLDALWETASLIIGEDYKLTPLEGFILGGAFLLHDAALCFEAYENGLNGIRNTQEWKDSYKYLKLIDSKTNDDLDKQADFITIRNLHAKQAKELLNKAWDKDGKHIYLLEDCGLRTHLGKLIGEIASSHNWPIERLMSTFNSQQNAPTEFPTEWRINPLKIACILRCADAAHIDNKRAPDFLLALLKKRGVSFDHWNSQNRLAKVDIDTSDYNNNTLLYTSTIDFNESDSEAWFIAYDAICLVDKEIKSCNSILTEPFKVKQVKGIETPESLSKYVKANGWQPSSANVHVQDVEKIIQNLGGEMLYGENEDYLAIVLRELIQNSRDSIKSRAVFDPTNEGKILISIDTDGEAVWLTIEDNGVGMSERVLKDSLLNFGTSFWTSELVLSEFPGLLSSNFKPVGKFGIGFYSVFMIAEQIFVTSKNYKSGIDKLIQLKFPNGFSLRPILVKCPQEGFSPSISTKIKLKLKPKIVKDYLNIKTFNIIHTDDILNEEIPFKNYLAILCTGLNVNVFCRKNKEDEIKIHTDINSRQFDKQQWITDISFTKLKTNNFEDYIKTNINRLKPIIENEQIMGLAAINTGDNTVGIRTIGGLADDIRYYSVNHIGYIDYLPNSARRDRGTYTASISTIKNWANDQLKELLGLNLSATEKFIASSALCSFGIDSSALAQIPINIDNKTIFMSIEQLTTLSKNTPIVFTCYSFSTSPEEDSLLLMDFRNTIESPQSIDTTGFAMIMTDLRFRLSDAFCTLFLDNGIPVNNNSILDCLYRSIKNAKLSPILEYKKNFVKDKYDNDFNSLTLRAT